MSLGFSKLILLLLIASLAIREGRRLYKDVGGSGGSSPDEDSRFAGIGIASFLTVTILLNALPVLGGIYYLWFEELQLAWPPSEAPSRWILLGRQAEVFVIVADLVLVVWGGARRVAFGRGDQEPGEGPARDFQFSVTFDRCLELVLRASTLLLGFLLLWLVGWSVGSRWLLWLVFVPLAVFALDRGADFLVRMMPRPAPTPRPRSGGPR